MAKRVPIFGYWGIYPQWIITSDLGLAAWVSYALNKMDIESQGTIHRLPVIRANRYHSIKGRRPLRDVVLAKLENMVSGLFLRLYLSSDDSRITIRRAKICSITTLNASSCRRDVFGSKF